MSYYETDAGARVFSAGVLDFPAVLLYPAGFRLMDNLWRHMLAIPSDRPPLEAPAAEAAALLPERDDRERDHGEQLADGDEQEDRPRRPSSRGAARRSAFPTGPASIASVITAVITLARIASGVRIVITPISGALTSGPKNDESASATTIARAPAARSRARRPAGSARRTRSLRGGAGS